MAKYVLSLFTRIVLFAVVMLIVAKITPYDDLVSSITGLFDPQSADSFTRFMLGESDLEAGESLRVYFAVTINIAISIPVISTITTVFNGVTGRVSPAYLGKEWALSTLRLFAKILLSILLFWGLFRFLPYQSAFPVGKTYSIFTIVAVVSFNLLLTAVCYWLIMKKTIIKRSL